MTIRKFTLALAAVLGLSAGAAVAASLTDLYARVPPPPPDVAIALTWVKDGQIIAPSLIGFRQAIAAERASIAVLAGSADLRAATAQNPDVADAPQVKRLIRDLNNYLSANSDANDPAAALKKRARWIQRAIGMQHSALVARNSDCLAPCQTLEFAQHRIQIGTTELSMWDALFKDWRQTHESFITSAQRDIAATQDGAIAITPAGKFAVALYRSLILDEIERQFALTELAAKRADAFERGGSYLTPDAVSGASKKVAAPP